MSTVRPPVLSPNVYLQYLHVKAKNLDMSEYDALQLAYKWDKDGPQYWTIKSEIDSPIHMSQQDINEVLTTIADFPSSPFLARYAQPVETAPLYIENCCFCCGKFDHGSMDCPNSLISSSNCKCCYWGHPGHITFECPILKQAHSLAPTASLPHHLPMPGQLPHQIMPRQIRSRHLKWTLTSYHWLIRSSAT